MTNNAAIDAMRLDGGVLCLDFVNTVPSRLDGLNRDHLKDFHDLVYWARRAGIVDEAGFERLQKAGAANEKKAEAFFADALGVRELVYSIFRLISHNKKVPQASINAFNKLTAKHFTYLQVAASNNGFEEQWNFGAEPFDAIIAPIVKTAYDLLISGRLDRVKECSNCGWLFLDTTKNGRRRWCSMQDCGSNVKALQYYYRKKAKP